MALPTSSSYGASDDAPSNERLIPFPARATADERGRRRGFRRRDFERSAVGAGSPAATRRARRRRHHSSWLQRNALSIAAICFLVALLGLGFGLVQVLTRPDPNQTALAVSPPDQGTGVVAASVSQMAALPLSNAAQPAPTNREIQSAARVIEANYTVEAGDTLGRIASRYNTTVERIQAFNSQITDPRSLRIGTRLVIPPPL